MTAGSTETMLIKRYAGRRLYDPQAACYVAPDDIAASVRAGQSVTVVDARSGQDITRAVLADISAARQ